jgi:uncharacterized membrane protein YjjP (DUF1212 family)
MSLHSSQTVNALQKGNWDFSTILVSVTTYIMLVTQTLKEHAKYTPPRQAACPQAAS